MDIKPIETYYNGYRFRSRLEARWAVFFDTLGIEYRYEYEGVEKDFGYGTRVRYLPDFYFPKFELFGEVKGVDSRGEIPKRDAEKMSLMIDFEGPCRNGIVLLGNIPEPIGAVAMFWAVWEYDRKGIIYTFRYSSNANIPIHGEQFGEMESAPYHFTDDIKLTHALYHEPDEGEPMRSYTIIENALLKARQARFEFGEAG